MLSTRRRFAIFLVYTIATAMAVGLLILPEVLNSDINNRDPVYFDRQLTSLYEYNNGTDTMDLNFNVIDVGSAESNCSIVFDEVVQGYMNYTTNGTFVDNSVITTNMSLFWIHIVTEEGRSGLANIVGTTYQIYDLIGIIGAPNTGYNITVTQNSAYWPIEPGLHGAQACLLFNITDLSGVRVGSGIMDKTCGMVFTMEVNGRTLKLLDTTYDISRNRLYAIPAVIIFAILWPVLMGVYLFIRKKYLNKEDSKEDIIDSIFLTGLASAISAVDIYSDVWFYAYFGFLGSILLHASVIVAIAVFCLLRGYKIKAIIPGIMELAFVFFITLNALGDTFAPHLTAFLGLSLSFYAMLWVVGYKKPEKESSKLDGIFSHIV